MNTNITNSSVPTADPASLILLLVSLALLLTGGPPALAQMSAASSEEKVLERAKNIWESGGTTGALEILDRGIQDHPRALALHKLRGDIFAETRRPLEAVQAYDTVLAGNPAAVDVRWAKWSVLVRSGQRENAIAELQRVAQVDSRNPLVYLRLAQDLRKVDRLEESIQPYQKAVELAPEMLSWRLGMARARFDVLDYAGADEEVQYVLQRIPDGSPLDVPARNLLLIIYGTSLERGRRARDFAPSDVTPERRKEWAAIRADAWKLFMTGRYQEAEPVYRRILALNPHDPTAVHQLGLTLMELNRCEEALTLFGTVFNLNPSEEEYADTVFRMGLCLVELKRWAEALVNFKVLYETAVEFEKNNKGVQFEPGTRLLNTEKMAWWIEKIRPHVQEQDAVDRLPPPGPSGPAKPAEPAMLSAEEVFAKIASEPMRPQQPLETRASLMGRDADFSWFRYVIPAGKVMRDDLPTGEHEFIPLSPGDSFPATQREIYLVFGLVSASYDALPLAAQCFVEASEMVKEPRPVALDRVSMSTSDQSGYFALPPPKTGWAPGLYRCGLFAGERATAYSQVDEVRFRIVEPSRLLGAN